MDLDGAELQGIAIDQCAAGQQVSFRRTSFHLAGEAGTKWEFTSYDLILLQVA